MNEKVAKKKLLPLNCKMDKKSLITCACSLCSLYKENNLQECIIETNELHKNVHESLKNRPGQNFTDSFYMPLAEIVTSEAKLFKEEDISSICTDNLSLLSSVFKCFRISFFKSSPNQNSVAESDYFMNTLVDILNTLLKKFPLWAEQKNDTEDLSESEDGKDNWKHLYTEAVSACFTTFVNLMAGNSTVRKLLYPYFKPILWELVSFPVSDASHLGAAVLHHFLLEGEFFNEIILNSCVFSLIEDLLNLYMCKGVHSCFTLFCLELLLPASEIINKCWETLTEKQSLLALDILTSVIQRGPVVIHKQQFSSYTVKFFQEYFKKNVDQILSTPKNQDSFKPNVVIRTATFLCAAASSEEFQKHMQDDASLLITTTYFLKCVTDIGNSSTNEFSRIMDSSKRDDRTVLPAFGFKTDLVRLIAGLVYRNKSNQDLVREIEGISVLLENSQYDARNPLIREASIFALRNVLENNSENQKIISDLQCKGVAENSELEKLGLRAKLQGGKVYLEQSS